MSDRPRVAFVVDHPQRDLAGLVLTALELCRHGITCHLVPLNLQERELAALGPDFVVLNYLRRGNEGPVRALQPAGVRFGALDTEGGVWADCNAYSELLWDDQTLRQQVVQACMWGPKMAEHLVERGMLDRVQMTVTGCPRFDFYHPAWRSVLAEDDELLEPQILINTNFSGTNPRFVNRAENHRQYVEGYKWSRERVDEYFLAEERGIAGIIQLARDLARDFPQARIVVRPHPFERIERYSESLEDVPNITVDNTPTVQREIFRSAAVIQRSCSTAIEAGLAGVPALSPQWVSTAALIPIAEAVSDRCGTYAELRAKVADILAGRYEAPAKVRRAFDEVTRDWFHRTDGMAHRRVSETVHASLPPQRSVAVGQCRDQLYGIAGPFAGAADRLGRWARWLLRLPPDWSFRSWRSVGAHHWVGGPKAFGVQTVRAIAERIQQAQRSAGASVATVEIASARERGDYVTRFLGESITLAPQA